MPWLIALVVVAILTLVGHGIWVLLATICRALFLDRPSPAARCRHCGRSATMRYGRCEWCGRLQSALVHDEQSDLAAVTRQLRRWLSRGTMKPRTVERLLARLEAYRQSLNQPSKPPPAPAAEPLLAEVIDRPPERQPAKQSLPAEVGGSIVAPELRDGGAVAKGDRVVRHGVSDLLSATAGPLPPPAPPKPRRSLSETLATFMEERNIRWGELAGGLLIVCSSVALVISLWEQLEAIPYFQFFIFVAVSAALFGIGFYTQHRWKLASTSRGVLIIATLLVPLNFVAMIATRRPDFDPIALVTELTALGVFVALVYRAGRVLVSGWAWCLTLAVVGNSGVLLLLLHHPSPLWATTLGLLATSLDVLGVGAVLYSMRRETDWTEQLVGRLFTLIGIAGFAVLVTLGMIVVRSDDRWLAVHCVAPLAAVVGLPVLACGLAVMNALSSRVDQAALRTAGTAVALTGAAAMLAAVGLAWPLPVSLIAVGLCNFAALTVIGTRFPLPPLHAVAAACLGIAYVVASHLLTGHLSPLTADSVAVGRLFVTGQTGTWLIGLFAVFAALAEFLTRRSRTDGTCYWIAAAATASVSLSLVTWPVLRSGGHESLRAAFAWGAYGLAAGVVNLRLRRESIAYASRALLYGAALFGATAWLIGQPWVNDAPWQLLSRPSLQCYAAACAALSLVCITLGILIRKWMPAATATIVREADRTMLRGMAAMSLALASWQALPGVWLEFVGIGLPTAPWALDTSIGWWLLAIVAGGLVAAMWERWQDHDALAAVWLSVNAAVLAAIPASTAWATASALRWALALVFAGSAVALWFRAPLRRLGERLGCRWQLSGAAASQARAWWVAGAALPVVIISIITATMRIAGQPTAGPLAGTWFASLGLELSHLVPLAIVVLALVAYALREASPGYAFGAGIIANLTVTGGYALSLARFGETEAVRLLQLATITAAAWCAAWLVVRRVLVARWSISPKLSRPLLRLQVAECGLGSLLLTGGAAAALFLASPVLPAVLHDGVAAVGAPLGWLTLLAACGAGVLRIRQFGERLRPELMGLGGLALWVLVAATIEWAMPGTPWAYRALLLGWALYALSVVVATWWAATAYAPDGAQGPPLDLVRAAAIWVRSAGLLALALGVKTVLFAGIDDVETLWAAGAIGIASAACAAMAVWLRREGWAFTAGLGVNFAASLAVYHQLALQHYQRGEPAIILWQANTIAAAVVALVWLAAHRRIYAGRTFSATASPLLSLQVAGVSAAALGLVVVPAFVILAWPNGSPRFIEDFASRAGWFAWLLAGGAAGVYLHYAARRFADVLAVALLGLGVLAAAGALPDAAAAFQTLTTSWLAAGLLLLIAGWLTESRLVAGAEPGRAGAESIEHGSGRAMPRSDEPGHRLSSAPATAEWLQSLFSPRLLEPWIAAIPLLLAGVALRGTWFDADWGYALGSRVLAAAVLPAVLAVWRRQPHHLYNSALLVHAAASLFWYGQTQPLWIDLVLANALAAFATAGVWSLWTSVFGPLGTSDGDSLPPLEHAALATGAALLATAAGWSWLATASDISLLTANGLTWLAVGAGALAATIALWDKRSGVARPALYAIGISAVAFALVHAGWQGADVVRATAPALAGWLLATATVPSIVLPEAMRNLWCGSPARSEEAAGTATPQSEIAAGTPAPQYMWFSVTQAGFGLLAVALSLWANLYFELPQQRLAGPATAALLLAATFMSARGADEFWRGFWKVGSLVLLALLPAELGWTWLTGENLAIKQIHQQVILVASLMAVAAVGEVVASRWLSAASNWAAPIRHYLSLAIGTTLAFTVAILVQEFDAMPALVNGTRPGVPMALAAKTAMAAVLIGLVGLALRYALAGQRDPLRLPAAARQGYVYAAELLVLATCIHVRVTLPKLLPFGIIENWWTLVVMVVAFCGVGLSELFKRRNLDVLSIPLRRTAMAAPLLPVLALMLALVWHPTGKYELLLRARLVNDEAVFFLVALFYGLESWLRRSFKVAVLSAAAGNAGIWLLWQRLHFDFLVHPQLWLIPPALAVLVAEYINHARLSRQQSDAVRYLALSVIYISSTADVFISHVGREISLPLVLVLMGLSVLGMLSGMLLEIRSFLYVGFTFLLVDLSIMVYHAAWDLGHTWVFWASGIAVGAAILALFAVFEKRRNEAASQLRGGK